VVFAAPAKKGRALARSFRTEERRKRAEVSHSATLGASDRRAVSVPRAILQRHRAAKLARRGCEIVTVKHLRLRLDQRGQMNPRGRRILMVNAVQIKMKKSPGQAKGCWHGRARLPASDSDKPPPIIDR
jgi:hypothetical protein